MRRDRLKNARENLTHTQKSLADVLGVDQRQVWRWENGEHLPNADALGKLALALSVSADWLIGISDDPTPSQFTTNTLSMRERSIVAALRRDEPYEAIKMIVREEQRVPIRDVKFHDQF